MSQFSLSWTVGRGSHCHGGTKRNPAWSDIATSLEQVRVQSGSVTLNIVEPPESEARTLQVFSDHGEFVLMFGEQCDDDYIVRTFSNAHPKRGKIEILGDLWDPKTVCSDLSTVQQAFKEFFDTGDVSRTLMDY